MELHTKLRVIGRGSKGRTCCGSAAYRAGENILDTDGRLHRYNGRGGVMESWMMVPENTPDNLRDRQALWQAADLAEHRADGSWRKNPQLYRDWVAAIPNEFSYEHSRILLQELLQPLVDEGMVVDCAIHDPEPKPEHERNQHVHAMLSMREMTPEGFGKKNRDWNRPGLADELRTRWAELCNRELQRMGVNKVAEHLSFEERGLDQIPQRRESAAERGYRERLQRKYGVDISGKTYRYNRQRHVIVSVPKTDANLYMRGLECYETPYHRLTDKERKNTGASQDPDLVCFAVPQKEADRIDALGAEFWDRGEERAEVVRNRQRDIWKIYEVEKSLTAQLNIGQESRKAAAEAAWNEYHMAKDCKTTAYREAQRSRNQEDWATAAAAGASATAAYNRAKNAGGEAGRSIKAERLLRSYRNYAMGLAKDTSVPKEELQRAVEAYKACVEALSAQNNSKTRSRLRNGLEALRAQSERAAKRRRRQALLRQLKALLTEKTKREQAQKPGLDSAIQNADKKRDAAAAEKANQKPAPEREQAR